MLSDPAIKTNKTKKNISTTLKTKPKIRHKYEENDDLSNSIGKKWF